MRILLYQSSKDRSIGPPGASFAAQASLATHRRILRRRQNTSPWRWCSASTTSSCPRCTPTWSLLDAARSGASSAVRERRVPCPHAHEQQSAASAAVALADRRKWTILFSYRALNKLLDIHIFGADGELRLVVRAEIVPGATRDGNAYFASRSSDKAAI